MIVSTRRGRVDVDTAASICVSALYRHCERFIVIISNSNLNLNDYVVIFSVHLGHVTPVGEYCRAFYRQQYVAKPYFKRTCQPKNQYCVHQLFQALPAR